MTKPKRHIVIPDCQVKPGDSTDHLAAVGNYIAEKRPDVVVCLGDFADMQSLSCYDLGKASAEGRRYIADISSARLAMRRLLAPVKKGRRRHPRLVLTLGNHEGRIDRAVELDPKLVGALSVSDLQYERDWEVVPFLQPIEIDQILYAHYFVSGPMGRPVPNARALLNATHQSAVMGHQQQHDIAIHRQTQHVGLIAGECYPHHEKYLGPQGNTNKRGIWLLNEVRDGTFDHCFVSLEYLKRSYS